MKRSDLVATILFLLVAFLSGATGYLIGWSRNPAVSAPQPVPEPRMIYLEMRQYNVAGLDETLYVLRYFDTEAYRTVEIKAYSWPAISKVRRIMK